MQVIPVWDNLPALSWRNKVAYITHHFSKLEQTDCPLKHIFEPGVYIRELRIPKGTLFTGREHLLGHECQLLEGSVIMIAPDGRYRFDAYSSIHTKPGYHAVAAALEDCVARTIHPNPAELRDTEALEAIWFGTAAELIERGYQITKMLEYEESELKLCPQL